MKKITLLLGFMVSCAIFSQEETPKMYKATPLKKTIYGKSSLSNQVSKSIQTTSSRSSGGGTVNGSTVDHLSVSLAGGVNYSVPIDVPPGLNGVQPKLAWTYDSHTGNGLAGWGWNISGISVITRIPSTLFHDNLVDGVDFDDNDRFALDGQRLIVKTGNYGGNGSVYQTEQYSNLKVISYGSHPESGIQGPASFKVFYPDGSIGHYGLINGSQNAISKMDYAISYWENPQGLRISYTYTKDNGTLYVDTITYGSKGQAAPINEVEFLYVDRIFRETAYVGGHQFIKSKRLYKIDVKGAFGVLYKSYAVSTIGGNSTLNYTRVSTIFERSGDNSQSREISFDYYGGTYSSSGIHDVGIDETPTFAGQLSINNVKKSNGSVISLDFTGNGELDFLVYPTTGPDTRKKFWMFTDVDGSYNYSSAINTGVFRDLFPVNWLQSNNQLSSSEGIAVVQDEGNTQIKFSIIGQGGPQVNGGPETKYSKIWDGPTYQMASDCSSQTLFRVPLKYVSGDFNGDGLSDVIAIERNYSSTECSEQPLFGGETCSNIVVRDGNQYCCYCSSNIYNSSNVHLIELDRRKTTNFVTNLGQLGRQLALSDVLIPLDVNGDGKTDILQFQDGEVFVYSIGDNGTLKFLWSTPDTAIDLEFPIMPGDYNGDGKTDFMMATANNSNNFVMFLSTGVGFEKKDYSTQNFEYRHDYTDNGTNYGYNLIPADMNGDGKTDIIEYKTTTYTNSTNGSQYIRIHQNAVKAISSNYPQFFASDPKQSTGNLETFPIPIFLSSNQENGGLQFASISDKWVTGYKSLKDHREDVTLKRITNNGLTTDIKYDVANLDYQNTTDPDYFKSYSTPGDELFPFVNIKAASSFKVVRELQQTGSGLTRTRRFYYEGAVSHANGLGFQGFEVVKQSNWYGDGVPALWTITKHDPLLRGFMTEKIISEEYLTNPSSFMSKVNYFYDYQLVANPGSPTAPQYQSTYILDYTIPGVLTRTAEESITLSPGFYANGANGLFLAEILPPEEQPGDFGYAGAVDIRLNRIEKTDGLTGVFSSETYSYDTYNNPLVTTTTFSEGSRVLTYTYANNAGATNNTYHIGKPTKMTERLTLNGNSFTTEEQYGYNNNLMTQIKRKGDGTDWVIQDLTYDTYGNIITKTQSSNGLTTRVENFEYSNAYNNRFLTKSTDIEGLETTFSYNAFTGLLIRKTGPFGLATSYQHDAWYRIAKETDYLNNDTDHTYTQITGGELQHDIDYSDGSREMTYYNAFGWVTRSGALSLNNEWSYVDYEHDVSGRVKRESQPHNGSPSQWNTMAYDAYGRPISEQLFTGRNITMTYSGLSSTVNDGVKSVTTTLDALGNTIKVQDPGGTIDYTYHASGQLKTADYGGHVVSVGVDGWGRKTSLNDPSAGNYTYSYNNYGELLEQT
ncbi:MAG: FG-GAP-like repeat-containing protein, partial [Bacteroidota bacterium]